MKRLSSISFFILVLALAAVGQSFTELSGPYGGRVDVLRYDAANSKLYAVVNNRLFKSADNGVNWSQVIMPASIFQVVDVITDGSKIIVLGNNNFITSTDGGQNWTLQPLPDITNNAFLQIIKHPTTGIYLVRGNGGVAVSVDNGVNWKTLLTYDTGGSNVLSDIQVTSTGDVFLGDGNVGLRKHSKPVDLLT